MPYKNKEDKKKADKRYMEKYPKKLKEKARKYYIKNKEKILKKTIEYAKNNPHISKKSYEKNREKILKHQREYYLKNKKRKLKKNREYNFKNKEKLKETSKLYSSRPEIKEKRRINERTKKVREQKNEYIRNKRKTDKNFVVQNRLRRLVGLAFEKFAKGKKNKTSKKYGIEYDKIINHLKPFPKDLSKYHVDHIRPLCSFKFINEDDSINLNEIKKAFAPENHQWLTAEENMKKGGKY